MTRVGRWATVQALHAAKRNHGKPCVGGCGWPVDPAATKNWDGDVVYDRHPGCEPGGTQLRVIKGGTR